MSTHNILFSITSGSLEIKLDHTHTVIDRLGANAVSETTFNHSLKVSSTVPLNQVSKIPYSDTLQSYRIYITAYNRLFHKSIG
jgi:outer membrane protein W